jgi:CubicO group peptidase (beta-lactamase class C family)
MSFYHVKGLSIAVVHDYKVEWAKGYGWADEGEKRPVTTGTLFQAASVSKSLNAVGILKSVQEKKIDLYADINNYLTTWKFPYDAVSKGKKISTANLLSHTGGLSIHGFPGYVNGEAFPTLVETLDGKPPAKNKPVRSLFKPGFKFEYSGGGTMISQLLLMDVTHEEYADYMRKKVLEPMGMTNSFFTLPPPVEKRNLLATGYFEDGKELPGKFHNHPAAAGGMWTTPADICNYIIEMQLSLQGKSNKVLSKETTALMMTPFLDKSSALGVFIEKKGDEKYFQHSGGSIGFRCQYYGSLDGGNGVMVMINSNNGTILQELVNNIARIYDWKDFYTAPKTIVKTGITDPLIKTLDSYTGAYRQNDIIIRIIMKDNVLWYQGFEGGGNNAWRIYFTSDKDFFSKESRAEKSFYFDANRTVKGFSKMMDGKALGNYEKIPVVDLPDSLMALYAGNYEFWGMNARVYKGENKLWLKISEGYELEMNFFSKSEFFMSGEETYNEIFRFFTNSNGVVDGIIEKKGDEEILSLRIR